jgi:ubiquinone/menaquinone biosynthesis C-methylase UbiE
MTESNRHRSAGSYAFGGFRENAAELERLKSQAGAAQALERDILRACGLESGMAVLDLACGPGIVSCLLAEMVEEGRVTGVDLSEDLLAEARQSANRLKLNNLAFCQGDVYGLELPDDSVDFIYARFLFQHLAQPEKALVEARRLLRPGGIMAIVDVDDDWLSLYPEPDSFRPFVERAARLQARQGGDRRVGRKLASQLVATGFASVHPRVYTLSSRDLGLKALLDLITGYKYQQLLSEDNALAKKEKADIYALLERPDAWGFVGLFVATGIKPGD